MSKSRLPVCAFCAGMLGFIALTLWAAGGRYLPGEERLLTALIGGRQPMLNLPMQLISGLGSMNVLLPLWAVVMIVLALKRQALALLMFLPVPLGYPLYAVLKSFIGRPAPAVTPFPRLYDLSFGYYFEGLLRQRLQELPPQGVAVPVLAQPVTAQAVTMVMESGYPSGHALLAALFYLTLAWLLWNRLPAGAWRTASVSLLVSLAFLVGIARVYMAVHFPSDILGAWLLAIPLLVGTQILAQRLAPILKMGRQLA